MKKDKKSKAQSKGERIATSYSSKADPLGSYSGVTPEMSTMPRKRVDILPRVRPDGAPVQDADDL
jgi:hypothetical protein